LEFTALCEAALRQHRRTPTTAPPGMVCPYPEGMAGTRSSSSAKDAGQEVKKPERTKVAEDVFRAAYNEEKTRWAGLSERLK
jgi:hypothetical protein